MAEDSFEFPNEIAQNLLAAETSSDPRYDASARNLVAEKPVLAYILKSTLDEYNDYSVQEIAEKFIEGIPEIKTIAIRLLSKMFSIDRTYEEKIAALTDEFQISVTKKINKEVLNVCNLSTGVYNKGVLAGEMKGRQEGVLKTLFGLVKDGILSVADAAKRANMKTIDFEKAYKMFLL